MIHSLLPVALLATLLPAQQETKPAAKLTAPPAAEAKQGPSQAELVELRTKKLAKPVFQKAPWVMDYDQARQQAKQEGKLLFTYFTRSYAG
ncbi:MAG: hypothetical protein JNK49_08380 [Planctomycetes bacterium]|nr:hypothetical protein [Planctomycetota bacterium]